MYSMQGAKIELHGNHTREYVPPVEGRTLL